MGDSETFVQAIQQLGNLVSKREAQRKRHALAALLLAAAIAAGAAILSVVLP